MSHKGWVPMSVINLWIDHNQFLLEMAKRGADIDNSPNALRCIENIQESIERQKALLNEMSEESAS